jgi:NitT/TauT family transport system substrate-binding protein
MNNVPGNPRTAVLFLSALLALIIPVSACRDRGSAPKPEKVTICVGGAPGIPLLLAREQGLFSKQGIDVEVMKTPAGPVGFGKMLAGECDMAATSETAIVLHSFERRDFSILAATATSEDSPRIVADRKSGIRTPRDLKGKRILVFKGSANHYFLDTFLARNGLSGKEVSIIFTNGTPDVSELFQNRKIDAFCASDVLVYKPAKALGDDAVMLSSPGLCFTFFHISAMNTYIRNRPEIVRKVLAALLENETRVAREPERAMRSTSHQLGIDVQSMGAIWNNYNWSVVLSQPLLLSLEHEARWAIQAGLAPKTAIPNYLDFIHVDTLRALKPEAVTMIK